LWRSSVSRLTVRVTRSRSFSPAPRPTTPRWHGSCWIRLVSRTNDEDCPMTEIAERPIETADAGAELGRVTHWIGVQLVEGTSGRRGPVYDPATGRQAK